MHLLILEDAGEWGIGSDAMTEGFNSWKDIPVPESDGLRIDEIKKPQFAKQYQTTEADTEQPQPAPASAQKMQRVIDVEEPRQLPAFNTDLTTIIRKRPDPKLLAPGEELQTLPAIKKTKRKKRKKTKD
ncbi:hypothetical protein [Synechococcus sp. MIT S9501]|uniref:hypothetical protein n=1 Tax=Synechococcus sp. MIT S9501 TaxID=3082545 RepID=UPI0039B52D7A